MQISPLAVLVVVSSGMVAGVLFAVALSVVPALMAMPADRYLYTTTLLGRNWDPVMPILVLGTAAGDLALALLPGPQSARLLFGATVVLMLGVAGVSHLCNVPINRMLKRIAPDAVPADWADPRPRWRAWHLLRTTLAVAALTANSLGVALT
ncbi:anthrone oxygenase family protein [Nonomuraea cavernae]|uniref:anthrone oxygenase family protein n=1 Tax=Nonomuraea cavernae TaxID=2045107 RepID=UPI0033EEDF12